MIYTLLGKKWGTARLTILQRLQAGTMSPVLWGALGAMDDRAGCTLPLELPWATVNH